MNINDLQMKKASYLSKLFYLDREKVEIQTALSQVESEIEVLSGPDSEQQIWDQRNKIDYDTKEFTLERISNELQLGNIVCALSSTAFRWNNLEQSKFIESIILGLPIPPLLMADSKGQLFVIDGMQRVLTINAFLNNHLQLSGLTVLDSLNGLYFKDLIPSRQRKFLNTSIRTITFSNTTEEVKKDLA